MKILIVGGGLGGMMLAASLEMRGIDYQLIERSAADDERGFSLGVWCNTRDLFRQLDLGERFEQLGTPIHRYNICDCHGRVLRTFQFEAFYQRYGMAYTQVNRRQLRALLISKTHPRKILFETHLVSILQKPGHIQAKFSDGRVGEYDLVVGADGVHSTVRELAFGKSLQTFTGWRAWYVWIDSKYCPANSMVEYLGPGRCLGIFADGPQALAIFFARCEPAQSDGDSRREKLAGLFHRELASLGEPLVEIREPQIMATDLAIISMKQWVSGHVVLMGDAAYTFEPHTGLGASMAMEDGFLLAAQLQNVSDNYSLDEALTQFQTQRQTRRAIGHGLNRKIRMFAFIQSAAMRGIANHLIPLMPESLFVRDYYALFKSSEHSHRQFVADK